LIFQYLGCYTGFVADDFTDSRRFPKKATARAKGLPHFQKQLDDANRAFEGSFIVKSSKKKQTISYLNKEEKKNEKEISISFSSYHGYH